MSALAETDSQFSAYSRALAAYQERRLEAAFRYAQQAVREDADHVDARVLLGQLHYLRQELGAARKHWERALELAPSREDIRGLLVKVDREEAVEEDLARGDAAPFVVRFAERQTPVDLGELKRLLRDAHRRIGQQVEYFPDHPITVLLYPEEDFRKVQGASHRVAGLYDGKIRLPVSGRRMTGGELERILWHEYTHALVHDLAQGRCPVWLNEGIATLQESRVKRLDLTLARAAFRRGALPSWADLWGAQYSSPLLDLYYQAGYLMARYLVERWNWRELVGLLRRLGQGYPIEDALRRQYAQDPEALEKEWRRWLRRAL